MELFLIRYQIYLQFQMKLIEITFIANLIDQFYEIICLEIHSLVCFYCRPTLLDQVIKQSRHIVMCRQTMWVLDDMAVSIRDPQITTHWSHVNSADDLSIKVHITSNGYEMIRLACL